jgi:signal transduction histidine kinase
MVRRIWLWCALAGGAFGVTAVAVSVGAEPHPPALWIPDLLTGLVVLACGAAAWARRPDSGTGPLLELLGATWFLGSLGASTGIIGWVGVMTVFVHRGVMLHMLVAYPERRVRPRAFVPVVVAGYLGALALPFIPDLPGSLATAVVLVGASVWQYRITPGRLRRSKLVAASMAGLIGVALVLGAVARATVPVDTTNVLALIGYELAIVITAIALTVELLRRRDGSAAVTDLAIDASAGGPMTLGAALAWAVGDRTLDLAWWSDEASEFVDGLGRTVGPPDVGRSRTLIADEVGVVIAQLDHEIGALDDAELVAAVTTAVQLERRNAELLDGVAARLAEVDASRFRLLRVADDEGVRLEQRLETGALTRLMELEEVLRRAASEARDADIASSIEVAFASVSSARDELRDLAHGLSPIRASADGLRSALVRATADVTSGVEVDVDVRTDRLDPHLDTTIYFICAEGLANALKHSGARVVSLGVAPDGSNVRVTIADDGCGGAVIGEAGGLRGLHDRVAALGGTVEVVSPRGSGTRIVAMLPIART